MRMQLNTTYTCVNKFTITFDITHPYAMNGASRTSRSHLRCDGWGKRWLRQLERATNGASLVLMCMKNKSPAPSIARWMAIHRAMDFACDLLVMFRFSFSYSRSTAYCSSESPCAHDTQPLIQSKTFNENGIEYNTYTYFNNFTTIFFITHPHTVHNRCNEWTQPYVR
jgi:hypothetical protein